MLTLLSVGDKRVANMEVLQIQSMLALYISVSVSKTSSAYGILSLSMKAGHLLVSEIYVVQAALVSGWGMVDAYL